MKRLISIVVTVLVVAFILLVLAILGLYKSSYHPAAEDVLDVEQGSWASEDPEPGSGKGLKVLFMNLNHGLGRDTIWYERTPPVEAVHETQQISRNLDAVVSLVRDQGAVVLVLQEVDFGSEATGEQDQAEILARRLGWAYVARARVHMCSYPLYPDPWSMVFAGRLDSGMAVLSPYPIHKSVLAPLAGAEDRTWVDDAFGPIGAAHEARIRVGEDLDLKIIQIVLDQADPRARERQASAAAEWIASRDHHDAVVYATTWAEPARRPRDAEEAEQMGGIEYTMDLLRHKGNLQGVVEDRDFFRDPVPHRTWLGTEGADPLARFDHVFFGASILKKEPKLLPPMPELSDHVPLLVELDLP